jgi:hypothetical protein
MDLIEFNTHSFIVKIWLEETAEEAGQARWRGHITHVPSGERRYVQDLDDIAAFIAPYLEKMGVKLGMEQRFGEFHLLFPTPTSGDPGQRATSGARCRRGTDAHHTAGRHGPSTDDEQRFPGSSHGTHVGCSEGIR